MIVSPSLVRIGIVGCGNVLDAYLALLARLERQGTCKATVFCGRAHQRNRVHAASPAAVFLTDYSAMLAREDVDVVVVLTPMTEHSSMAQAALQAGKHVLLEKPMATNLREAEDLLKVARCSGRHLVCAPFTILSPTFQIIAEHLRQRTIGKVASARGRYGWAGPDWTDWFYRAGGGALFDLGVYLLTTLTGWLGPVRRVTAFAGVVMPERMVQGQNVRVEAEDNVQVLLDFGENRFASITTAFAIQQYRGPAVELFGTEGTINLLGDDWDPDGYELWQNTAGCWKLYKETHPDWPWTDGLRHLVDCLREQREPLVTPEHAFHVLEVMVKAQSASADGVTQSIASTYEPPRFETIGNAVLAHRVHDRTRSEFEPSGRDHAPPDN